MILAKHIFLFLACTAALCFQAGAADILLRLKPSVEAPVVTRVLATKNVLLDAAQVQGKPDWQQLTLDLPLEGYVPVATLSKNFEIVHGTPVHFLPTANAFELTTIEPKDSYEVVRVKDEWATIKFTKKLTGYFNDANPTELPETEPEPLPEPPRLDLPLGPEVPQHTPKPQVDFDPDGPVSKLKPNELPPENVIWKSAPRDPAPARQPQTEVTPVEPIQPIPAKDIMVGRGETQAREAAPVSERDPSKPSRLLVGILHREIKSEGPPYPVRLRSPEGRLIAYVDFSGIFIKDLSPYLGNKVFIRGKVYPIKPNSSQLVILAKELRLAD